MDHRVTLWNTRGVAESKNPRTATGTAYVFGYGRVSTTQQDLTRQLDALGKDGIPDKRLYVDKKSGSSAAARAGLQALLGQVRPGDVIVVHTLDRLGRNIREVLNLIHDLTERGIHLRSLADPMPVDTTNDDAMNRMSMLMLAMFAEMERVYSNERAAHAREVRRASGKQVGRKKAHADKDIEYARLLRRDGHSFNAVAARTGIPVGSLHRYLSGDTTPSGTPPTPPTAADVPAARQVEHVEPASTAPEPDQDPTPPHRSRPSARKQRSTTAGRKHRGYTGAELDTYQLDPVRGDTGEILRYAVLVAGDTLGYLARAPYGHTGWQAHHHPSGAVVAHSGGGRYAKNRETAVIDLLLALGITATD